MAAHAKARVVIGANNVVHVKVSGETMYNLEATQQLMRSILGRVGCPACCSGLQFLFQQEEQEMTIGG